MTQKWHLNEWENDVIPFLGNVTTPVTIRRMATFMQIRSDTLEIVWKSPERALGGGGIERIAQHQQRHRWVSGELHPGGGGRVEDGRREGEKLNKQGRSGNKRKSGGGARGPGGRSLGGSPQGRINNHFLKREKNRGNFFLSFYTEWQRRWSPCPLNPPSSLSPDCLLNSPWKCRVLNPPS